MSNATRNVDLVGRRWSDEQLDKILGEPAVMCAVEAAADAAVSRDRTAYSVAAATAYARRRYRRQEVVALFVLLVQRFFALGLYLGDDGEASA